MTRSDPVQAREPSSRSEGATVAIADDAALEPVVLLDRALNESGFWTIADAALSDGGRVVILLDLATFDLAAPSIVRVDLVERLIDSLAERGFPEIAIASSADSSSTWAENRAVEVLADLAGYRYETARSTPYDVLDLSEDLTEAGFPAGSALVGTPLSRRWLEADLRIVFAKCRTDERDVFALCASTLVCALPLADKDYYYRLRVEPAVAIEALVRRAPPHFALVDACPAAHGSGGRHSPEPAATHAVIAGAEFFAVDCAVAAKMGTDPAASTLLAQLMRTLGTPRFSPISGNVRTFDGFRLPDPLVVESTRARDRSPALSRLVAPWLQCVDARLFPHKNALDAKINAALSPRLARPDSDPAGKAWLIYFNILLAAIERALAGWHVVADKDGATRRVAGISPETLACGKADYRAMESELEDLERWLDAHGERERPLRWRYLDRAVVFDYQRDFPVAFDEFSSRVDISRTIQFMNDYIGGTLLPVERDAQGRPVRQVERNLYLPQPNYLAWWGGKEIDVSKIESVRYAAGRERMYWKTIKSENGSAIFDDGIVTFQAVPAGTRVTVFGRQLFVLPPVLDAARLDLYPELKNHLVTHAYETFFARTFANFEALLEGRAIAIGRAWHEPRSVHDTARRPIDALTEIATNIAELAAPWIKAVRDSTGPDGPGRPQGIVDDGGFTHFGAQPVALPHGKDATGANPLALWLSDFYHGYTEALARDLKRSVAMRDDEREAQQPS